MKALHFFADLIRKYNSRSSIFSEALTEGIRDVFIEMGYRFDDKDKC
ncbi:hypothetical protein [Lacibacter sp.]|nr:hypothetical protein [Lacibacter sp.]